MRLVSSSLRSVMSERDSVNDLLRSMSLIVIDPCKEQVFRSEGRRDERKMLIIDSFCGPLFSFAMAKRFGPRGAAPAFHRGRLASPDFIGIRYAAGSRLRSLFLAGEIGIYFRGSRVRWRPVTARSRLACQEKEAPDRLPLILKQTGDVQVRNRARLQHR